MKLQSETIQQAFHTIYPEHQKVRMIQTPYRICPLGAHIDHQLGNVTGMAVDRYVMLAYAPNYSGMIRLRSLEFDGIIAIDLNQIPLSTPGDWSNYVGGAALVLNKKYGVRVGFDGIISGSMPVGGLSSSAAVSLSYLLALEDVNEISEPAWDNIKNVQFIENKHIGVQNGILDQSMIMLGKKDHLLHLNCKTNETEFIPLAAHDTPIRFCIAYSGLSQSLAGTSYNARVTECADAAHYLLKKQNPQTKHAPKDFKLGNVSRSVYELHKDELSTNLKKRAQHFFDEMDRVKHGIHAFQLGDWHKIGELMRDSGLSSITKYECGAPPLIHLFECMNETSGVLGARFSGAGFRGSCIALVDQRQEAAIQEQISQNYLAQYPEYSDSFLITFCQTSEGATYL